MVAKIIEIRDAMTFIPALAIKLGSENDQERWLLSRAGYGSKVEDQEKYVVLVKILGGESCEAHVDPFEWGQNPRTYFVVHKYVEAHFDSLEPGAVIDVEFILGKTTSPKYSERVDFGVMP
jgi:hypothetical protein